MRWRSKRKRSGCSRRCCGSRCASSRSARCGADRGLSANHSRVERIKALIASGPAQRWTLDGLAAAAAVSPYHLAHLFKAQVGLSVYEYVVRARLAAALERVLESGADLTTIALDAGFSSHSHFTAQFRARFGTTPLELRRQGARRGGAEMRRIATAGAGRGLVTSSSLQGWEET